MTEVHQITVEDYQAIIAPFLMMTSCATLVWALQNRFSRLVQAIRTLSSEGKRDNIDYTRTLATQIIWLKGRSYLLRNSIAGLYFAMCCFLLTAMLMTLAIVAEINLAEVITAVFLLGLLVICGALITTLLETSRSFLSLKEEIEKR